MLELFLGQIPEAIFFALFMIFAKGIKEKRILFVILMIAEYLLLKYSFPYSWFFQIGYMITTFVTLKVLYKEKSQITDIFLLLIAYIIMIASCAILYFIIWATTNNYIVYVILHRLFLILFLFIFNKRLINLQKIYKKFWNRNDKVKKKIKSVTFRGINIVAFNIIFFTINAGMVYAIYYNISNGGI